jgi:hypothetical protein
MATFGYTSAGATRFDTPTNDIVYGSVFTSGAAGTLDKITVFLVKSGTLTTPRVKAAIYSGTTLVGVSTNERTMAEFTTSAAPYDFSFSGETINAATDYGLVVFVEHGDGSNFIGTYRDNTGGTSESYYKTYGSFNNPATWTAGSRKNSIYATYTEAGGATGFQTTNKGVW